ncbi:hypothetical protein HELRODRAFT_171357 [Helobdella robusta]|uniref:Reverse transcriptase domain-containing protein n=1 Tax=Helobdella robusta TaxID=6412 RepID=T1F461_HELRO|nr:hypothetical protein HELRODRAFT_171357 [Helobdella robusta]ESO05697.1 hypothetical protein HELRODRAFT_171357 [Helobdella robusta]
MTRKSEEEVNAVNTIVAVNKDKEKRENNIVIFGIPLSKESNIESRKIQDKAIIEDVCKIENKKPDILMICDTWWTDTSATSISGYSLFRQDRNHGRGGVIRDTIKAMKNFDGSVVTNGHAISNILNNYSNSVFTIEDKNNFPTSLPKTNAICTDSSYDKIIIKTKLRNLNVKRAIGVDGVHPRILKKCSESLAKSLKILFDKSYENGKVPELWLCANVTPLYKKGNKSDPSNYRPVSLTSVVCKIMESITRDTLMKHK